MLCLCCVANENNTRYSLVIYHYHIISECCKMLHNINKKQNSRIEVFLKTKLFFFLLFDNKIIMNMEKKVFLVILYNAGKKEWVLAASLHSL